MDADCYLLGGDGNALGPYQLSTVQNWYDTGQIAAEQNMSVGADGAWQEAQYVLAGAELDMGTVAEEDTDSAITSLSTDCFLLDAEGQALGPFALADVASWLEQGSIDGETQMASFDGNEWVNVQVALRPGASSGKSKESRLFLFSVAEGTSLGPFNHSDVLTWYTSGDIGGDQYVSNEENPEDWVTAIEFFESGRAGVNKVEENGDHAALLVELEETRGALAAAQMRADQAEERAISAEERAFAAEERARVAEAKLSESLKRAVMLV